MDVLAQIISGGGGAAQWVFLLGLILLIFILLMRSRRYFRQVARHQAALPPTPARHKPQVKAPTRQHEQWEVSMHELARDLSGQLDSKIRVLELLIREASQAASRLETALNRARVHGGEAETEATGGWGRVERAPSGPKAGGSLRSTPATRQSAPPPHSSDARKSGTNPRFERVYALADAGLSPTTIANQIGSQLGEVELILSLRTPQS